MNKTMLLGIGVGLSFATSSFAAPGTLHFSDPVFYVAENATEISLSVQRSGGTDGDLSVDYALVAGSATANVDYNDTAGTVNFGAGQNAAQAIVISLSDDLLPEPDETFRVVLSTADPERLSFPSQAWVRIIDHEVDSPGRLRFETSATFSQENAGSLSIKVLRTGGSHQTVAAALVVRTGSAVAGTDFTLNPMTLSFADGEVVQNVVITLLADAVEEQEERATLVLEADSTLLHAPTHHVLSIADANDNSAPTLSFVRPHHRISEDLGHMGLGVRRAGGPGASVVVGYNVTGSGTASSEDYLLSDAPLSFASFQVVNLIELNVIADAMPEGTETLTIGLDEPSEGNLGELSTASIDIIDHENGDPGQLSLESTQLTHREDQGFAPVTIQRQEGSFGSVSANFQVTVGTAQDPDDFEARQGTLVFGDGEVEKTFSIPVFDDELVEGDETVLIELTGSALGTVSNATLILIDDEQPGVILFEQSTLSVVEGIGVLELSLLRQDGADGDATVRVRTSDATATAGQDYEAFDEVITFLSDEVERVVPIVIQDDFDLEGAESFVVTVSEPSGGVAIGTPESITITIEGGEPGTLSFVQAELAVDERSDNVLVEVVRAGGSTGDVLVDLIAGAGSVDLQDDLAPLPSQLFFADGSTRMFLELSVVSDARVEGNEELNLRLANPTQGASLGVNRDFRLIIEDVSPESFFHQGGGWGCTASSSLSPWTAFCLIVLMMHRGRRQKETV